MTLSHLIFDLDNTLYPPSRGVVERVDARINHFMIERLGLAPDVAGSLRAHYRDAHGTTLNGLMLHHEIEPDDYLAAVHEIAVEELLAPDPGLRAMLAALPHHKAIFTNGSTAHAERVLACLGMRTVLVGDVPTDRADVDGVLAFVHNLPALLARWTTP